jgi:hypothetical protein
MSAQICAFIQLWLYSGRESNNFAKYVEVSATNNGAEVRLEVRDLLIGTLVGQCLLKAIFKKGGGLRSVDEPNKVKSVLCRARKRNKYHSLPRLHQKRPRHQRVGGQKRLTSGDHSHLRESLRSLAFR